VQHGYGVRAAPDELLPPVTVAGGRAMSKFTKGNREGATNSPELIKEIRAAYARGETQGSLCKRYPYSIGQIGRIVRGEVWKDIPILGAQPHEERMLARMLAVQRSLDTPPPPLSPLEGGDAPSVDHSTVAAIVATPDLPD